MLIANCGKNINTQEYEIIKRIRNTMRVAFL